VVGKGGRVKGGGERGKGKGWWEKVEELWVVKGEGLRVVGKKGSVKGGRKRGWRRAKGGGKSG
jgi:hypothetical protein